MDREYKNRTARNTEDIYYVTTYDKETADKLLDLGFIMVEECHGKWVFLNL